MKTNLKNVMSKLMLFVCAFVMALSFNSCSKDKESNYEAGKIPGLGDAAGELTGTPFTLPSGVVLTGAITGSAYQDNYWNLGWRSYSYVHKNGDVEMRTLAPVTRTEAEPEIHYFGSGRTYVNLLIPMHNNLSTAVTVTFPAATIIRSQSGDCQNGVLLKKVVIIIPAGSDYHLCLSLYCGNHHRDAASYDDIYEWGVVSNVQPLLDLCNMVKNKKINIEEFTSTSMSDYNTYEEITSMLQEAVWEITDDEGLSQSTISEINALPNS